MATLRYDADGLPTLTWTETFHAGGHLNPVVQFERRCAVERMADGALHFVTEELRDESGSYSPAMALIGWGGFQIAKWAMRRSGVAQKAITEWRPWAALDGFRLTSDVDHLGVRTMAGTMPSEKSPMIIAGFGTAYAELTISRSEMKPFEVNELHRVLNHEFVVRRADQTLRLTGRG